MTVFFVVVFFHDRASFLSRLSVPQRQKNSSIRPLAPPRSYASHFLLPIRAISSALAAALVLMSWFLARSMRTLRMLVGTSRDKAKRDPCWVLRGSCTTGRGALAGRRTVWCLDRSSDFNMVLWFSASKPIMSLWVSSSSLVGTGLSLWLRTHQGSSRARQKQTRTPLMVETVCQQRRGAKEGKEVWLYSSQIGEICK